MLKKKLFATGLATIMMAGLMMVPTNNVFAQEGKYVDEKDIVVIESSELERPTIEENIKPRFVNDFRNRKKMLGLITNGLLSKGFPTIFTQGMQEVLYHRIN